VTPRGPRVPVDPGSATGPRPSDPNSRPRRADRAFDPREIPPRPVAWLHPAQLVRTGYHALLSTALTSFLDRRETLAALGRGAPVGTREPWNGTRGPDDARDPDAAREPHGSTVRWTAGHADGDARWLELARPARDASAGHGVWIDFAADIGDSWDATYATATLLASPRLAVRGHGRSLRPPAWHGSHLPADWPDTLRSADVVVLGGDLVYPTPSRDSYRARTRSAFIAALPAAPPGPRPALLAIPGNHDWYDGLTAFVRQFCQGGAFGGWSLVQDRSYFALRLTRGWWLWGIDIALDTRIDAPQQSYFLDLLPDRPGAPARSAWTPGDRIILCTAKPIWLDDPRHSQKATRNLKYFIDLVTGRGASVPVVLSGDVHHYSRYASVDGRQQFIVAGGGGAYLTGTHHLPRRVPALTGPRSGPDADPPTSSPPASVAPRAEAVTSGSAPSVATGGAGLSDTDAARPGNDGFLRLAEYTYPTKAQSQRRALGAVLLALRRANWPFALVTGLFYWLLAWPMRESAAGLPGELTGLPGRAWDLLREAGCARVAGTTTLVVVLLAVFALASNRGGIRALRAGWGLLHAAAHIVVAIALAGVVASDSPLALQLDAWSWPVLAGDLALGATLVLTGAICGATLFGVYLVVSDWLFGWHRDEVFSCQSIIDCRNFLRMRIDADGTLTIYPIGLARVPRRWRASGGADGPLYEPGDAALEPHLIEPPVRIPPAAPSADRCEKHRSGA
jgi:hypothetical protein